MSRFAYAGITLAFFVVSAALHWLFGWHVYSAEALAHGQAPVFSVFLARMTDELFANWSGHALQLLWQLAGLAWFLRLGFAATNQRGERVERKLDLLLGYLALHREREDIDQTGGRHG